jgi:hypothetical protein
MKTPIHIRHPYAGDLVYTAFSGSHQDAIRKGMKVYEETKQRHWEVPYLPIDPSDVGRSYESIIRINSQSGKGGIAYIMEKEYGMVLPKQMHPEFASLVQRLSDEKGTEILPKTIWAVFEQEYLAKENSPSLRRSTIGGDDADGSRGVSVEAVVLVPAFGTINYRKLPSSFASSPALRTYSCIHGRDAPQKAFPDPDREMKKRAKYGFYRNRTARPGYGMLLVPTDLQGMPFAILLSQPKEVAHETRSRNRFNPAFARVGGVGSSRPLQDVSS